MGVICGEITESRMMLSVRAERPSLSAASNDVTRLS